MTFATLAERPKTDGDDVHEGGDLPRSLSRAVPRTVAGAEPRVIPTDAGDKEVRARLDARDLRGAIAACARHYGVALGRLCFAMLGIQSEAEETTQETLLAAYDALETYRGEGTVRSWLYGIARRLCARRLEVRTRQARRSRLIAPAMAGENDQNAGTDVVVDAARRGHAVRVALEALRPTEREAVLLRFESDLSFKEVGEACGIDEAAARKRVSRALARLRERLAE